MVGSVSRDSQPNVGSPEPHGQGCGIRKDKKHGIKRYGEAWMIWDKPVRKIEQRRREKEEKEWEWGVCVASHRTAWFGKTAGGWMTVKRSDGGERVWVAV